jgi:hypothetical protein
VAERLREHWRVGNKPHRGGLYTLEEVAVAGREEIARIRGIGPKAMSALDAALDHHGLKWAAAEAVTV